jgi:hypothetical protein
LASLRGEIAASGVDEAGTLVKVTVHGNGKQPNVLSVARSFETWRELAFTGRCDRIDASSPCVAELPISFERTDNGAAGGTLSIDWSLDFESSVRKEGEPDVGPLEAPWEIEVVPE